MTENLSAVARFLYEATPDLLTRTLVAGLPDLVHSPRALVRRGCSTRCRPSGSSYRRLLPPLALGAPG
ncbi:hypothetical protein [Streptomyces sp. B21-083]|uniref:hypothetical protein n=1 Tax=Streptomyces sp. B21-083 TaxID=3039410 RepID=UPI002FEE8F74